MPTHIGRYRITSEPRPGEFSPVYTALDPASNRVVAIRILNRSDDEAALSRFRSEAAAVSALNHENIAGVYEFGEDQGMPYVVTEAVDGVSLDRIIAGKLPLTLAEKTRLMSEVARGLHAAHQHGIVHRDLTPASIVRLRNGSTKIMDFGIARLGRSSAARDTQPREWTGRLAYMAPEQFLSGAADALADIWSFGVVFYELVAGRKPFSAANPAALMYQVTREDPPPIRNLASDCPPSLANVIHRLLRKERGERYQSLADVLSDLEPVMREVANRELTGLIDLARSLVASGDLDEAQTKIRAVLELDPVNSEAQRLFEELRARAAELAEASKEDYSVETQRQVELLRRLELLSAEQAKARRVDRLVSEAHGLFERQAFAEALQRASEAAAIDPSGAEAAELIRRVQAAMESQQRARELSAGLRQASQLLKVGRYDEAIDLLSRLRAESPADPQVTERLRDAIRIKEANEARSADLEESRRLIGQGNFEAAISLLQTLLREDPGNTEISKLLESSTARLRERRKASRIAMLIAEARAAATEQRHEEALAKIDDALRIDPGNAEILGLLAAVQATQQAQIRASKIAEGVQKVQSLLSAGTLDEALSAADMLEREFPSESAANDAMRRVRAELAAALDRTRAKQEDLSVTRVPAKPPSDPRSAWESFDDVQFTIYRPSAIAPEKWYKLLAFAHRSTSSPLLTDPAEEVRRQAESILGASFPSYRNLTQDSTHPIPRRGQLTFVPEMPYVTFSPLHHTCAWEEGLPPAMFDFKAERALDGGTARGYMRVFLGSIIVAQIALQIAVDSTRPASEQTHEWKKEHAPVCRRVFASYSHRDTAIVEQFEMFAEALGDDYIRDIRKLRVGDRWSPRLLTYIEEATIFQLFWSSNSMRSDQVRREYTHALSLNRESFVLPVYWEPSFPRDPEHGLPPPELEALHFYRVFVPAQSQAVAGQNQPAAHVIRAEPGIRLSKLTPGWKRALAVAFALLAIVLILIWRLG